MLPRLLVLLTLLLLTAPRLQAAHVLAGNLSYQHLTNNQYKVQLRLYRDCAGINFASIAPDLEYRTTGCTGGPWPRIRLTLVPGSQRPGTDYCAAVGTPCSPAQLTNYESAVFEATLVLPPAQWVLSVTLSARPTMTNVEVGNGTFYTEATLDNRPGLSNSSPSFGDAPDVEFLSWNQLTLLSTMAADPDGDSLAYELVAPLQGCNDPTPYKPLNNTVYTTDPGCTVVLPVTMHSPTFPVGSFTHSGAGGCTVSQITPFFDFNPASGSIALKPAFFMTGGNREENRYAVSVKVSEYRHQATGPAVLVGTRRREMLFNVVDAGANQKPVLAPLIINNGAATQPATAVIAAPPGQLVSVRVTASDPNAGQLLTMTSNAEQVLPNAELTPAAPNLRPTLQIDWLPPVTLPHGLYYCTVKATDDACPLKGAQTFTLAFRVGSVTAVRPAAVIPLAAVPTPFQGQVRFQLAQPGVQSVLVFDRLGRQVAVLHSQATGLVQWRPEAGLPAGLYLARTADGRQVARLLRTGND